MPVPERVWGFKSPLAHTFASVPGTEANNGLSTSERVQRWWQTTVRRRPITVFITNSFTGELL